MHPRASCLVPPLLLLAVACAQPRSQPAPQAPVLGAHADADSARYVGAALVHGPKSREALYREYPRHEPNPQVAARLAEILGDRGKTLHWSAQAESFDCPNGDVKVPILVRVPPACADRVCPVLAHFSGGCAQPRYHWRAEFVMRAGFIYAEPNIRGTPCSEAWSDADNGGKRLDAMTDIAASGKCLRERFTRNGVAPKLGIFGWSFGGNVTLQGMTRFAGTYDAGFALAAKTDLGSFFLHTSPELRAQREAEYGDPEREPELFRQISPVSFVDRVRGPIAIMLGGRDPKVSLSDADVFVQKLRERHEDVSLMMVPEHGHLTERPEEIVFEHAHILEFFADRFGQPLELQ